MRVRIPVRQHLAQTSEDDPAPYYYTRALRYPYRKRLQLALNAMGGRRFDWLLEIGYGSGVFFPELARRCNRLVGVDLHRNGPRVRRMMDLEALSGHLGVADVLELPFGGETFEGVICLSVLEFIEDLERAMDEIHRVLEPDGMAVLGAPVLNRITGLAYERLIGHRQHREQHRSDHRRILRLAEQRFSVLRAERFVRCLPLDYAFFFCVACRKN
jgi:ubiquinone/menaquinone biosynthesis C-methylase UbiE